MAERRTMPQTDALKREEVEDLFSFRDGFHDVDWPRAAALIERNFDPLDQPKGFDDLVLLWLERLRDDLGGRWSSRTNSLLCAINHRTQRGGC